MVRNWLRRSSFSVRHLVPDRGDRLQRHASACPATSRHRDCRRRRAAPAPPSAAARRPGSASSPSRSTPTVRPPRRDSRRRGHVQVGQAGEVRLVGVRVQPDGEPVRPPVVADAGGGRDGREDRRGPGRRRPATSRCPRPTRESTRGCRLAGRPRAGARRCAPPGSVVDQLGLQRVDEVIGVVLVEDLHQHLRVVGLRLLRRRREPEARPAAADERRHRLEHRPWSGAVLGMRLRVVAGDAPDRLLDLVDDLRGRRDRRVLGQPDVDVGQVLQVLREVLRLELRHEEAAEGEHEQRRRRGPPSGGRSPPGRGGSRTPRSRSAGARSIVGSAFGRSR